MSITVESIRIERRSVKAGHPFSDLFITTSNGDCYYSRLMYPIDDTPHQRAYMIQEFLKRMERAERADRQENS